MVFDAAMMLFSVFERLISYVIYLGRVVTIYWVMHSALIHFYLIILAGYDNRVWDPGVDHMYRWLVEDLVVVLFSLRLDEVLIRVV